MAWYELNRRAPPTPHRAGNGNDDGHDNHRHPEGTVDVENYLDDRWSYAPSSSRCEIPSSENGGQESSNGNARFDQHLNFDGFQHQVESQLANVFPTASSFFSSSESQANYASRQSTFHHYGGGTSNSSPSLYRNHSHDPKEDGQHQQLFAPNQNQNQHPNTKNNAGPVSKTEQFFHPRPVRALMPYKSFFSPLVPNEESDAMERKTFLNSGNAGGTSSTNHQYQQDSFQSQAIFHENSQQNNQQQQDLFHSQIPHQDNTQQNRLQQHDSYHSQAPQRENQVETPPDHGARDIPHSNEPSQEISRTMPMSNLKPKDLFDSTTSPKTPSKRPAKQAKLVQDSTTGQVTAKSNSCHDALNPGEKRKEKSWDNYAGRPLDDGIRKVNPSKEKTKEKKKAKKKKSKDKKQLKDGNDIASLIVNHGKKQPSNGSQEGDGAAKKKSKDKKQSKDGSDIDSLLLNHGKKRPSTGSQDGGGSKATAKRSKSGTSKPKKQRRAQSLPNPGTELEIPSYGVGDASKPDDVDGSPTISVEDFNGIEEMKLQNAAQCKEGLEEFLTILGRQKHVAFTMLFLDPVTGNYTTSASTNGDGGGGKKKKKAARRSNKYDMHNASRGYECTTPFLPTSKTYCTPKGPQCTAWNCTCDEQIRAMRGSAKLLGAMFVFKNTKSSGDDADGAGKWECYLLPLGPTDSSSSAEQEVEYTRMSSWPVTPFVCDVGLSHRWGAFEAILLNEGTKLVTYNAVPSLLPYYHHLSNDSQTSISAQYATCLAGASGENVPCRNDGYLRSVWDLRLVSWMLRPHATDAELEFKTFQEGFAHLAPDHQQTPTPDMPILMQGLAESKNNLEIIYLLYPIMNNQMVGGGLTDALDYIEAPVQSILARMESQGIGFQSQRLKKIENDLETRIGELETQSRSITKDPDFLLSSPQQVSAFLFDVLKLTIPAGLISKTKAGSSHRSTSEEALKAIQAEMKSGAGSSPQIIDIILEFRGLNKLLTTYIRPLPKVCRRVQTTSTGRRSKKDPSRIYPQWMQTAVRTGRLSCRKPNLQQIPNEGAFGVNPRDAFVTDHGMCLFACDYSQKEVRILAHMSGDEALLSLFIGDPNVDIYKQMSSLIRNKPIDAITQIERAQFKQVTLALLYGMSANQVAKKLSISKSSAQQMMRDFFRRFRRVKVWMDETKDYARKNSYVKTIAGRKRYLDDINSDDNAKKSQAERQAINTVIQGSAADLMKSAMINMAQNLMSWQDDSGPNGTITCPRMLLQIHDELILELRLNERDIKRLKDIAKKSCCLDCETFFGLKVPLLLKVSCGRTWGAMKEDI